MLFAQPEHDVAASERPPEASLSDAQLSHLRAKAGRSAAASCHSVRYHLTAPVDLTCLREKLEGAFRTCQEFRRQQPVKMPAAQLWIDAIPGPADSTLAERRRNAELMRAVDPLTGPACRAVLLQYQDRTADLIVVAHRALLDYKSLLGIAGAPFCEGTEGPPCNDKVLYPSKRPAALNPEQHLAQLINANYSLRADWGMGNPSDAAGTKLLHRRVHFEEGVDSASLTAAVGLVLSRYSGQTAPVIAALAPCLQEDAGTIGANAGITLVPFSFDADVSAAELLETTAQVLSNPSLWYTSCLAETLSGKCENRGVVLLGVLFSPADHQAVNTAAPVEYVACLAPPFPVTLACSPNSEGVYRLTCLFTQKDFAEPVMAQFISSVLRVHRELRHYPKARLSGIDILDQADRERVTALGRCSQDLIVPDGGIDQLFTRKARQNPQAVALSFGQDRLSYSELDEHSERMAQALRSCGLRAGDRVGVCLEPSLELVEVLLAILKAGGTYVPIDPAYPAERLAFTIIDAQINLVIALKKDFPAGAEVRRLEPQELLRMVPGYSGPLLTDSSPSDAAYVIYTSGSTGRPKGVVVPHSNVTALLAATSTDFELSPRDTWTLFHSSAFDFSVWEIWACLLTGGHLVIVPYWITRDPEQFAELLAAERVTILNQTPSAFAQLLDVDRKRPLTSTLRLVILGGEPLDTRMLLPWFDRHPEFECRVVNMFGITETTVHVTLGTVTREDALLASKCVGGAITGWYYYVMDAQGRPLPPGVAGEIYVGGAGVAQGYLNRPELTAQRFVPDPYRGGRLYCSGDKGRLRLDGRLEHLGRLDTQVKVRGFRIELDEIRSVLLESPGVHTAAVIVHRDDPNDPASAKLCAYLVLNGANMCDIRNRANRVLPEYMVPSVLIEMPSLPLTQNGKLDIKLLPPPHRHSHGHRHTEPAPRSAEIGDSLTAALLQIWQTVLGVPVGLDDNFFDLGGNSLYAMRIAAAMRDQGLPVLPVRELYVRQTVRRLRGHLRD